MIYASYKIGENYSCLIDNNIDYLSPFIIYSNKKIILYVFDIVSELQKLVLWELTPAGKTLLTEASKNSLFNEGWWRKYLSTKKDHERDP